MKLQELYDILRNTEPAWLNVGVRDGDMNPENFPIHTFSVGNVQNGTNVMKDIPYINVLVDMDRIPMQVGSLADSIERFLPKYGQKDVFVSIMSTASTFVHQVKGVKAARICSDRSKFNIEY